jgi:hypothetical protein
LVSGEFLCADRFWPRALGFRKPRSTSIFDQREHAAARGSAHAQALALESAKQCDGCASEGPRRRSIGSPRGLVQSFRPAVPAWRELGRDRRGHAGRVDSVERAFNRLGAKQSRRR